MYCLSRSRGCGVGLIAEGCDLEKNNADWMIESRTICWGQQMNRKHILYTDCVYLKQILFKVVSS